MDKKPVDVETVSVSEATLEQKKPEASSSKDTTVPTCTSGQSSEVLEFQSSTTETSLDVAQAGPSSEKSPIPEETVQMATTGAPEPPAYDESEVFQLIILVITALWPLTFLTLGICFIRKCGNLSLITLTTGLSGVVPFLIRIFVLPCLQVVRNSPGYNKFLLSQDISFMISYIVYNGFLYSTTPNFDPKSENYCDYFFYSFSFYANFVSIALVVPYTVARIVRGIKRWSLWNLIYL